MAQREWERILIRAFSDAAWDESTELASLISDDHYPSLMDEEYRNDSAARIVVALVTDADYRACIEAVLAAVPLPYGAHRTPDTDEPDALATAGTGRSDPA